MKTELKTMTINGVTYVQEGAERGFAPVLGGPVKIVILQRGWVMVGYYQRDGANCTLRNASVLRQYGTTKGLGEIAEGGPTSSTKLDPCNGLVEFHRLTEVATITCVESKWHSKLV